MTDLENLLALRARVSYAQGTIDFLREYIQEDRKEDKAFLLSQLTLVSNRIGEALLETKPGVLG